MIGSLVAPAAVDADEPVRGRIVVPGDHFQPGESISIVGVDLDEDHEVILRLTSGSTVAELGRARVAPDRSLSATATIPLDFPLGYAELSAADPGGSTWTTLILVGDRAEAPGAGDPQRDDRLLPLIVLAFGLMVFVVAGAWYLRGRSRPTAMTSDDPNRSHPGSRQD
jgi:hypothetical protein